MCCYYMDEISQEHSILCARMLCFFEICPWENNEQVQATRTMPILYTSPQNNIVTATPVE